MLDQLFVLWKLHGETDEQYAMRKALRERVLRHPRHRFELAFIQEQREVARLNVLSAACFEPGLVFHEIWDNEEDAVYDKL